MVGDEDHQDEEEGEAGGVGVVGNLFGYGFATDYFDNDEDQSPAVEGREWDNINNSQ